MLNLLFVLSQDDPVCEYASRYQPGFPGSEKSEEKDYLLLCNQSLWNLILYPIYG